MRIQTLLILASFCIGGCQAAKAPLPEPAANVALSAPLSIGPDGALGLNASVPYAQATFEDAAKRLQIVGETKQVAKKVFVGYDAVSDGVTLYEFWPSADLTMLRAIHTASPAVAGPQGEVIGASTLRDAPEAETAYCKESTNTGAILMECAPAPDSAFWRIYRAPPRLDQEGLAALQAHEAAVLVAMRWVAVEAAPAPQESFKP